MKTLKRGTRVRLAIPEWPNEDGSTGVIGSQEPFEDEGRTFHHVVLDVPDRGRMPIFYWDEVLEIISFLNEED